MGGKKEKKEKNINICLQSIFHFSENMSVVYGIPPWDDYDSNTNETEYSWVTSITPITHATVPPKTAFNLWALFIILIAAGVLLVSAVTIVYSRRRRHQRLLESSRRSDLTLQVMQRRG